MEYFITICLIIIMINQFLIQVKLMDIEERMKIYKENEERLYKWCRDVVNYIFSTRRQENERNDEKC